MALITVDVTAIITGIHIVAANKRLILTGSLVNADGRAIRGFDEDVTDLLSVVQLQKVVDIVTRAQQWIDSKSV